MTGSALIVILVIVALYGMGAPLPFKNQLHKLIDTLIPFAPLLIAIFLLKSSIGDAVKGVWTGTEQLVKGAWGLVMMVVTLTIIFPVMLANTFLLGPLAMWIWKYQAGLIFLIILSGFGLSLLGGISQEFAKQYLIVAVVIAVATIGWNALTPSLTNTHRIKFTVDTGNVFADPVASIQVKAGDKIKIQALGAVKGGGKTYGPQGDHLDPVPWDNWWQSRGEMMLTIWTNRTTHFTIPVQNISSGPKQLDMFDFRLFTGGYYMAGETRIPDGINGYLGIDFLDLPDASGIVNLTLQINPEKSTLGVVLSKMGKLKEPAKFITILLVGLLFYKSGLFGLIPWLIPLLVGIYAVTVAANWIWFGDGLQKLNAVSLPALKDWRGIVLLTALFVGISYIPYKYWLRGLIGVRNAILADMLYIFPIWLIVDTAIWAPQRISILKEVFRNLSRYL